MKHKGKLIVISAPSGSGKSTVIRRLMQEGIPLEFSVSATSRPPREGEVDGRDYHFISEDEFRKRIDAGEFIEYEEVYPGRFYGTLRSEVDDRLLHGIHTVLDIDVQGAIRVKELYGDQALTLFIQAPSPEVLRDRLLKRGTDSPSDIELRVSKAVHELSFAPRFDVIVINDDLDRACNDAKAHILDFLHS